MSRHPLKCKEVFARVLRAQMLTSIMRGHTVSALMSLKEVMATKSSLATVQTNTGIPIGLKTSDHSVVIKAKITSFDEFPLD